MQVRKNRRSLAACHPSICSSGPKEFIAMQGVCRAKLIADINFRNGFRVPQLVRMKPFPETAGSQIVSDYKNVVLNCPVERIFDGPLDKPTLGWIGGELTLPETTKIVDKNSDAIE